MSSPSPQRNSNSCPRNRGYGLPRILPHPGNCLPVDSGRQEHQPKTGLMMFLMVLIFFGYFFDGSASEHGRTVIGICDFTVLLDPVSLCHWAVSHCQPGRKFSLCH